MAKYTFLDLAVEVLRNFERPLTAQEIWDSAEVSGATNKLNTAGKTPHASLAAQLYTNVKKTDSLFIKIGEWPARFILKTAANQLPKQLLDSFENEVVTDEVAPQYLEKDLHPLLVWFASDQLDVVCKTINHSKSAKKASKANEWIHPDIVGFSLETADWPHETVELLREVESQPVRFFSFELKQSLSFSNLRASFFQSVSNSSWAHESYLAASAIDGDKDLREELQRLSESFGIGIIEIDPEVPENTQVLFSARRKSGLDWAMINRLAKTNPDFRTFLKAALNSAKINKVVKNDLDPVPPNAPTLKQQLAS